MGLSRLPDLSLYLVTDRAMIGARDPAAVVAAAVAGGVTVVQYRDKTADADSFIRTARALKAALAPFGVPLIVNDRVAAAQAAGADGVHIGQGDGDPAAIRAAIGPGMILGLSVETPTQAAAVDPAVVDYLGAGPVHATATKPDHADPVGLDGLAAMIAAAPVPAVAIGGLGPGRVAGAIRAGAAGVAVVSAICAAADPRAAAAALSAEIAGARA